MMDPCVIFSGQILKVTLSLPSKQIFPPSLSLTNHSHSLTNSDIVSSLNSTNCSTDIDDWGVSPRGAGFLFGSEVVAQVCSLYSGTDSRLFL